MSKHYMIAVLGAGPGGYVAALKAALHCRGLCSARMLPPLRKVSELELENIRRQMAALDLLN